VRVSPDGKLLAIERREAAGGIASLTVVPVAGGEPRALLPESTAFLTWAPDSKSMIAATGWDAARLCWRVPVDGGKPQRLDLSGNIWAVNVDPSGRHVAYQQWTLGHRGWELWSVDLGGPGPADDETAPQAKVPNPVTWSITAAPNARAVAGRTFEAIVTAKIESGWHLYALSQPAGGPIAMSVTLPKNQSFGLAGKVIEPPPIKRVDRNFPQLGETLTFDDSADFTVPIRVPAATKSGTHTVRVEIEFQVCSDTICLPPRTVELKFDVNIGGAK
jgi:hypothetical protein